MKRSRIIRQVVLALVLVASASTFAQQSDVLIVDEDAGPEPEAIIGMRGTDALIVERNGERFSIPWIATTDGDVLMQGDIFLGQFTDINFATPDGLQSVGDIGLQGLFAIGDYLWPKGVVSYLVEIDTEDARYTAIGRAISAWEAATKIRFVKLANPAGSYVAFIDADPDHCSSAVGKRGGRQLIKIGENCKAGNIAHEIGHALGLGHEQMRRDRHLFVRYFPQNVIDGYEDQFEAFPSKYDEVENYCSGSLMHYGEYAFSKDKGRLKTLEALNGAKLGQRKYISGCDSFVVDQVYSAEYAKNQ